MLVLGDNPKLHGSGPDKSCAKLRAFPAVGICLSPGSIMSCDALKPWGCAGINQAIRGQVPYAPHMVQRPNWVAEPCLGVCEALRSGQIFC